MSPRPLPPFRADHVGSLLRPAALKEAREKRAKGEIDAATLKSIEDREIADVIRRQEDIGLKAVTDGEFRRAFWQIDFLERLDGVESYEGERKIKFEGKQPRPVLLRTKAKLGFSDHPMLQHFAFVKANARVTPKMTIPSPTSLHFRYGRDAIDKSVYPTMESFYADLGKAYAGAIEAFADAGCRYLQIDEVNFAYLCDPKLREQVKQRGEDPETLPETYATLLNAALSAKPKDMVVTMHLCRGNFQSTFVASGGYEPVAEALFQKIGVDGYFLEYDSERAGGFEPLRMVPKHKTVVLGLVTSKTGQLESKDQLKRRIDEASEHIDLGQLCLSPQCGFASTEEGNLLAEAEQWAKLSLCVDVARDVWGGV
jgi:5-methyltetrahydropteroyltriglutamate--homocysteine methyltransferase